MTYFFQRVTQAYSEKEIPGSPKRSRTYDLPITSSDALPLSYTRLVGALTIKLQSWPIFYGTDTKIAFAVYICVRDFVLIFGICAILALPINWQII